MKKIAILGSTGSVGTNILRVIDACVGEYEVTALSAHTNTDYLAAQAQKYRPRFVCVTGKEPDPAFASMLPQHTEMGFGSGSLIEACKGADIVALAIVGISGLPALDYCLVNHIPVAFATKEAFVCGGKLIRARMDETKTPLYPIDSELSAIWQCLEGNKSNELKRIWLTASGGPFRTWSLDRIKNATLKEALSHPNWSMGPKITVDCATMVNKGLEVMETRWLFDVPADKIEILVHPESYIHSMVEFGDGAVVAQLATHDMRIPISYALNYPERREVGCETLDFFRIGKLTFEEPDFVRFPCLKLAYEAIKSDDFIQLVLNSANEAAVAHFLAGAIGFSDIPNVIADAMEHFAGIEINEIDEIYDADMRIRAFCDENCAKK